MKLIDHRGRLFGLINIIDFGVLLLAACFVGFAGRLYWISAYPAPVIHEVTPKTLYATATTGQRIRLTGEHFDRFTRVKIGQGLLDKVFQPVRFIDAQHVEFELLWEMAKGPYFIIVANRANKMTRVENAFLITEAPPVVPSSTETPPPEVVVPKDLVLFDVEEPTSVVGTLDVTSFGVPQDLAAKVHVGDRQIMEFRGVPYVIAQLDRINVTKAMRRQYTASDKDLAITMTVRAKCDHPGLVPTYDDVALLAGNMIRFRTNRYVLYGLVRDATFSRDPACPPLDALP